MLFAQRAISDLSCHADWLRGYAATAIGVAFNMSGNAAKGIDKLDRLRRQHRTAGGVFHTHLETGITLIYLMQGNYPAMLESAELLIALGKKYDLRFARLSGCYFAGWALYAQNELINAREILSNALQDSGAAHSPYFAHTAFLLASCYVALGDEKNAQRVVAELQQVSIDYNQPNWTKDLRAFKVELAIRLGRKEAAIAGIAWVLAGSRYRSHLYYHPLLTRIKTLLFLGEAEGLKEGKTLLDEFRLMLSRMNDKRAVAEAQALVALIQDALGNRAAALETLKGVLIESGASLRTFLDLGEPMAQLLQALPQDTPCGEMIEKMLKAFAAASASPGLKTADSSIQLENSAQSTDPLSKRELEVLRLLGHRLRDKEIARKMNIAPGTVKSHLKSVYRKLGVGDRLEAAAKARAMDTNRASSQRGSIP
jgi:LuxR family maltose regulon positive regulatory protein